MCRHTKLDNLIDLRPRDVVDVLSIVSLASDAYTEYDELDNLCICLCGSTYILSDLFYSQHVPSDNQQVVEQI